MAAVDAMDIVDDQRDATRRALVARFVDDAQAAIARRRPTPAHGGGGAVMTSRVVIGGAAPATSTTFTVRCMWSRRSRAVVSASPTQRTPPNAGAAASLARAIVDADVASTKTQAALSVAPLLCQQPAPAGGGDSIDGILIQYTTTTTTTPPSHGNHQHDTNGDSAAQDASMRRALFAVVNWYLDGAHRHHGVGSTREYREAIVVADAAQ